jgi:hypothetical protein
MAATRSSLGVLTPRVRLIVGAVALLAMLMTIALIARGSPDEDAITTRATEGIPAEIPLGIVPNSATDVFGQVASRRGEVLSAAVDFTVMNNNRDALQADIERAAPSEGWNLFERLYDDLQMRLLFFNDANDTLTVTMTIDGDRILAAAVLVRTS